MIRSKLVSVIVFCFVNQCMVVEGFAIKNQKTHESHQQSPAQKLSLRKIFTCFFSLIRTHCVSQT